MNEEELVTQEQSGEPEGGETCEAELAAETEINAQPEEKPPRQRDFVRETGALIEKFPDLCGKRLPDEVVKAAMGGKELIGAYEEYQSGQLRKENARLQKELSVEQQNRNTAARAPVRGVSGGAAVRSRGEDDFLRGFNADDRTY